MGNAPPSNGNPRDDPRTVPVMGTNGHHPHHGPYTTSTTHQQHQHQKQHQQPHPPSAAAAYQQHPHRHGYSGDGNSNNNHNINMQESNSDASMSNVENNSQHHSHGHNQQRKVIPNGVESNAESSSALSNDGSGKNSSNSNPSSSTSSTKQQQQQQQQQNLQLTLANLAAADDDTVPTVFRWEHGGRQVYITGTFNGWSRQIPMHRSGNDFTYIHNLKRGKHAFKFIVDDEWRFAPDQPTVADIEGRINNFIDVTDFKPYMGDKDFEREKAAAYYSKSRTTAEVASPQGNVGGGAHGHGHGHGKDITMAPDGSIAGGSTVSPDGAPVALDTFTDPDGEVFTHNMPDLDEYTKDPPPLPPHLRHIILNKPPQLSDTAALPVPQHVALNHLYCTAIKDNMMVLGVTQRFRTKFVTTVYYSPELSKT